MISFYYLTHRFKRSLLEITSESPVVYYWDPDPLSKEGKFSIEVQKSEGF